VEKNIARDAQPRPEQQGSGDPGPRGQRSARRCLRELAVAHGGADMVRAQRVGVLRERREQRLVGEQVDASREPARGAGDGLHHGRAEELGPAVACLAQAEGEVLPHLRGWQRREPEAVGDAVAQLPDVGPAQRFVELGLPKSTICSSL